MFDALSDKISSALSGLSGRGRITEANVTEAMAQVRTGLLEADVHYEVARDFCERVQAQALGTEVMKSLKPGQLMIKIVHDELVELLGGAEAPAGLMYVDPGPTVVMMAGLQGSGKTTTCGKLAAHLVREGNRVLLVAADLQRPAAVDQLETITGQVREAYAGGDPERVACYTERARVAEYGQAVGAAVKLARAGVDAGRAQGVDVVILDTAGRLHVNAELMDELGKVEQAVHPHQVLLVVDAMTGQDAVNSAKTFNEQLELDGVILTKLDSDTRGGAALSVKTVTGKPIRFMGTGEGLEALEPFHADRIAGRILGMGDVVSLVEKAQAQVSEEEAAALQEKMAEGTMTMDDFLDQLRRMRKMGSMKSLMSLVPGIGKQLKDIDLDDGQIERTEAMIESMTRRERREPKILDPSRRRRIARGSGTQPQDVNQLWRGFDMVSRMSKQMAGMGMKDRMKSLAGMGEMNLSQAAAGGGLPAAGKQAGRATGRPQFKKRKRKGKSR